MAAQEKRKSFRSLRRHINPSWTKPQTLKQIYRSKTGHLGNDTHPHTHNHQYQPIDISILHGPGIF
jgi:hypothetical protein